MSDLVSKCGDNVWGVVFVDVMLLLRKLQNVLLGPGVMLALVLLGPNWNTGGLGPPRAVLRNVFTYLRTC